jgi:hypothetical protein
MGTYGLEAAKFSTCYMVGNVSANTIGNRMAHLCLA